MKTSPRGQKFIKDHEGLRLVAYQDSVGVWTIGYGHTSDDYFPVKPKQRISKAKAEDLFRHDMEEAEAALDKLCRVPLNGNQYGALISLMFNIGNGAFARSTLLKKLNRKDYKGASKEFPRWSNPKVLLRRRNEEAALFNTPIALGNKEIDSGAGKIITDETRDARDAKGSVTPDKPSFWSKLIPTGLLGAGMTFSDGFDLVERVQYTFYGIPVWAFGAFVLGVAVLVAWNHFRKTD